jgi:hypothetical protein
MTSGLTLVGNNLSLRFVGNSRTAKTNNEDEIIDRSMSLLTDWLRIGFFKSRQRLTL